MAPEDDEVPIPSMGRRLFIRRISKDAWNRYMRLNGEKPVRIRNSLRSKGDVEVSVKDFLNAKYTESLAEYNIERTDLKKEEREEKARLRAIYDLKRVMSNRALVKHESNAREIFKGGDWDKWWEDYEKADSTKRRLMVSEMDNYIQSSDWDEEYKKLWLKFKNSRRIAGHSMTRMQDIDYPALPEKRRKRDDEDEDPPVPPPEPPDPPPVPPVPPPPPPPPVPPKPATLLEGYVLYSPGVFVGEDASAPEGRRRRVVPFAKVSIRGPGPGRVKGQIVASQHEYETRADENGYYKFEDIEPGTYIGWAEKRAPDREEEYEVQGGTAKHIYPKGGYYKCPPKKFDVFGQGRRVRRKDEGSGTEYWEYVGTKSRVDFELEPITSLEHRTSVSGLMSPGERAEFESIHGEMDELDTRDVYDKYSDYKSGARTAEENERIKHIDKGYAIVQRREGEPAASEWLRDALLKTELLNLQKRGGGRYKFFDTRRGLKTGEGKFNPFSSSSYHNPSAYTQNLVKAATSSVIGIIVAAFLGAPYLFFGFLMIGLSAMLPSTGDLKSIAREVDKVTAFYKKKMESAESEEEQKRIGALMNIDITRLSTLSGLRQMGISYGVGWSVGLKEALKAAGFIVLAWGFVTSSIPLAKPIGIVIAFVGYFAMTFSRENIETEGGPNNLLDIFKLKNWRTRL